ncbi:hypothetical protein TSTA_104060 [Talaromyces stipitatus ATCC 10500]|uniref:Uncharacterized protein n=1 Tax=Talaromyces stipitatus (strain ATCC 10500 / CBS 375.48 / QM 6759 / NRRL 1006) TaxID=441959 RepID=B8MNU7_TALSN|nr:uncharacterized protein TSTA_104060 [Talaromyces stipitatus ATCC 10500]EED14186.1 hypothetical protein TSTA_104060 [Talaromyces stipitatus ATCC 10500]
MTTSEDVLRPLIPSPSSEIPQASPSLHRTASSVSILSSNPDPLAIFGSRVSTSVMKSTPTGFTLAKYKRRSSQTTSNRRIANVIDICQYGQNASIPLEDQYKVCVSCKCDVPTSAFFDDKSQEHAHCNLCRVSSLTHETNCSYVPPSSDVRSNDIPLRASTHAHEQSEQDPLYVPGNPDALIQPVLTENDWNYVNDFHESLDKQRLEYCHRCYERWFNLWLNYQGICDRCVRADKGKDVRLFSAANNLHSGQMPDLPELSQTEERSCVNFLRDTAHVYDILPLLPRHLEVILLRPVNAETDLRLQRQFIHGFRVRRDHFVNYRDITISQEAIYILPQDSSVVDDTFSQIIDPVKIGPNDVSNKIEIPEHCAVPDLIAWEDEIQRLENNSVPSSHVESIWKFR